MYRLPLWQVLCDRFDIFAFVTGAFVVGFILPLWQVPLWQISYWYEILLSGSFVSHIGLC
jgi:hypothetical protein